MQNKIIRGSGGGGEDSRTPIEAPNTLQSVQYARILDLVSEGEIGGLVNGLQSVVINGTPLLNENGTYNFSGVSFDYRVGTQGQNYISGFPSVENEVPVSTEVTKTLAVTRSITNQNINATRITVRVPQLTSQNLENGDLNGSSVTLALEYQNNGGGFVPAKIGVEQLNLAKTTTTATSGSNQILSANLGITWTGISTTSATQYCYWKVEYRLLPAGSWTEFTTGVFSGVRYESEPFFLQSGESGGEWVSEWLPPVSDRTVSFPNLTEGAYEFRIVKTSGTGSIVINYATSQYWTPNIYITGKTTSPYQRSVRLELPSPGPWDIRLSRATPDSTSSALQNKTFFDSYTEIIDAKLSYPNSAVFGLQIDARQFNSIPSRAYEIFGIKVKVPSNYDPVTRTYTGEWDGDFQVAWTNNPAWIFYDLVSNTRYGLGQFIDTASIDKWGLYTIGQYCDEFVSDGLGGEEPRFACNAFIQTRYEAYNLITQLASVFRSMVIWSAGQITCIQDRPSDVVALFTAANVVNGEFNYSGTSAKARHTVCLVSWNDPSDMYRQKVEYVEDVEGITRYGVIQAEIQAFGCTSRGQAHRLGKWLLFSERLETETVSFRAGMDAALVYPGAVIHTQDQFRSGKRFGGRTFNSTVSSITLDSEVEIESGKTYEISVLLPDGTIESRGITNTVGTTDTITLVSDLSAVPVSGAIWVLSASDLVPEEWRVVSIVESDVGIVEITALASRQDKYDAVENDLILTPLPTTSVNTGTTTVTNLDVTESLYLVTASIVGNSATVSWTGDSTSYIVSYSADSQNTVSVETLVSSYTFNGILPGTYTFTVQPVNALGRRGQISTTQKEIFGLRAPPANVSNFALAAVNGSAYLTFDPSTDLDVKVGGYLRLRHSSNSTSWNDAVDIGVNISGMASSAVVPLLQGSYLAKWVDSTGNESVNVTSITTDAPDILKLNTAVTISEHPDFLGAKSGVGVVDTAGVPSLTLDSTATIDELGILTDEWPVFSAWGSVNSSGEYLFDNEIDLGAVYTSRLSAKLKTFGLSLNNYVDIWTSIDDLVDIDGSNISDVSARIFLQTSSDGITYSDWQQLFVGDYVARFFKFKLVLTSEGINNIAVTECSITVDMPDTIYSGEDIVSGTSTYSVVFPVRYYSTPAIGITAQNMQTGDYYEITSKTQTGFDIIFKDQTGTNVSRTFDYISKGY